MRLFTLLLFISSLVLTGCTSTDSTDTSSTTDVMPTPAPQAGMGRLSLALTDAPVDDAYSVVVQFDRVSIRGAGETDDIVFDLDPVMSVDLLTLQGANSETVITDEVVPAGSYDEVRLFIVSEPGVEDSYIVLEQGGAQHDLEVPSGTRSGLKVKGELTVPADGSASFTIDFDVRRSIVKAGNENSKNGVKYMLKPVLHLVQDDQAGVIKGTVATGLLDLAAGCSDDDIDTYNAVYVFEGTVSPDDIDNDGVEPFTTALVAYNATSTSYEYEVGFLPAGDYTVAFTCNADFELVDVDDDLKFTIGRAAPVTALGKTVVDFTTDDLDSDGDGVADIVDAFPDDPSQS